MTTFLKFLHLATISIWSGGLIVLPFLFRQRMAHVAGPEFERLHRVTRFVYVKTTSPAAFLAIGSGTALVLLQGTSQEWFTLKMVFVTGMVMLHVVAGLVTTHLFEPDGRFGLPSCIMLTGAYLALVVAIVWVVLAKPAINSNEFAPDLFTPGALRQF